MGLKPFTINNINGKTATALSFIFNISMIRFSPRKEENPTNYHW